MSEVKVDTISERTAAGGVTIDGVLVKDGVATFQTAAGSPLVFEGATADAFETTFAITDPTADRTITFPDSSFTVPTTGGSILQVVTFTYAIEETTTSASLVDTSLTASITPASSSNKILVWVSVPVKCKRNASVSTDSISTGFAGIKRVSTNIYLGYFSIKLDAAAGGSNQGFESNVSFSIVDSPSATIATAYTFQMGTSNADYTTRVFQGNAVGSMMLMEIAG